MKTLLTRTIQCQSRGCTKRATWREVDRYTQQKQTFVYFYYQCDEHKEKADFDCAGHKKDFQKMA